MRGIKIRIFNKRTKNMIQPEDVINLDGELSKNLPSNLIGNIHENPDLLKN